MRHGRPRLRVEDSVDDLGHPIGRGIEHVLVGSPHGRLGLAARNGGAGPYSSLLPPFAAHGCPFRGEFPTQYSFSLADPRRAGVRPRGTRPWGPLRVDAGRPQGVALQVQRPGSRRFSETWAQPSKGPRAAPGPRSPARASVSIVSRSFLASDGESTGVAALRLGRRGRARRVP